MRALSESDIFRRVSVGRPGACWPWRGTIMKSGYGAVGYRSKSLYTHRLMYEWFRDPIPKGMFIDHMCRNRKCCNPAHLRVVTPRQNVLENNNSASALNVLKTHCLRGHPLSGENVYARKDYRGRECRACRSAAMKAWWASNG